MQQHQQYCMQQQHQPERIIVEAATVTAAATTPIHFNTSSPRPGSPPSPPPPRCPWREPASQRRGGQRCTWFQNNFLQIIFYIQIFFFHSRSYLTWNVAYDPTVGSEVLVVTWSRGEEEEGEEFKDDLSEYASASI